MISNETNSYQGSTSSQHQFGKLSQDKTFYDQVVSDFLKQSAMYLRDSSVRTSTS